jgi:hypothetical protein
MTTLAKLVARSALAAVVVALCGCAATNDGDDASRRSDASDKALEECLKKMGWKGKPGWGDVFCILFSPNAPPGCNSPDATDMGQCPPDSTYCKSNPDAPQCGGSSSSASSGQGGGSGGSDPGTGGSDPGTGGSDPGTGGDGTGTGGGGDTGYCGDGSCDSGEDSSSCPDDCGGGGYCGDGACDSGEDESSCPDDCGGGGGGYCGDGYCDGGEDADSCPDDCY